MENRRVRIKSEKKFGSRDKHFILCRKCGNPITTSDCNIAVNEQYMHKFSNPEGVIYEIGCFSSADGCFIDGDPTLNHTWFEDFRWNYSFCSRCFTHLGWHYQRGDERFFGLILDHLANTTKTEL